MYKLLVGKTQFLLEGAIGFGLALHNVEEGVSLGLCLEEKSLSFSQSIIGCDILADLCLLNMSLLYDFVFVSLCLS